MTASPDVLYLVSLSAACITLFAACWLPLFFGPFSLSAPVSPLQRVYRRRRPRPPNERAGREPHPWAA